MCIGEHTKHVLIFCIIYIYQLFSQKLPFNITKYKPGMTDLHKYRSELNILRNVAKLYTSSRHIFKWGFKNYLLGRRLQSWYEVVWFSMLYDIWSLHLEVWRSESI